MLFKLAVILSAAIGIINCNCLNYSKIGIWKKYESKSSSFPSGSFLAGSEGSHSLYVCRGEGKVGKYHENLRQCYIAKEDVEIEAQEFEMLIDVGHTVWIPVINNEMPCNLIQSGDTSSYIGRTVYEEKLLLPGNVKNGILLVTYDRKVSEFDVFEALSAVPQSLLLPTAITSSIFRTNVKYLTFKVTSEDEVVLYFGALNETMFRLTIGAFHNKVSGIGPIYDSFKSYEKTENILDPDESRGFWVRWTLTDTLEFGVEGNIKPLITYTDSKIQTISTVVFKSNDGESHWQIADLPVLE